MAEGAPIECVANCIASATYPGESVRFSTQSGTFALPRNLVVAEQVEALIYPRVNLVRDPLAPSVTVLAVSPRDKAAECNGYVVRVQIPGDSP